MRLPPDELRIRIALSLRRCEGVITRSAQELNLWPWNVRKQVTRFRLWPLVNRLRRERLVRLRTDRYERARIAAEGGE